MSPKRDTTTEFPRLVILSAPSGAGKTTLCAKLLHEFPEMALSISTTTRKPRAMERNGVHYFFVTDEEFQKQAAAGAFAESAEVHGRRYGTAKETIERLLAAKKHILFDIDVQGARSLKALYPRRVLSLFVHPPSLEILRDRLVGRNSESEATLETRMENAYREVAAAAEFDYQIVNDNLDRAYGELRQIIARECL